MPRIAIIGAGFVGTTLDTARLKTLLAEKYALAGAAGVIRLSRCYAAAP